MGPEEGDGEGAGPPGDPGDDGEAGRQLGPRVQPRHLPALPPSHVTRVTPGHVGRVTCARGQGLKMLRIIYRNFTHILVNPVIRAQ